MWQLLKIKYLCQYKIFRSRLSLEANKAPSLPLSRQFVCSQKQPWYRLDSNLYGQFSWRCVFKGVCVTKPYVELAQFSAYQPTPTPPVWVKILVWFIRLDRYKYSIRMGMERAAGRRKRGKGICYAVVAGERGRGGLRWTSECAAP